MIPLPFGLDGDDAKMIATGLAIGGLAGGVFGKYLRRLRYRRKDFNDIMMFEAQVLYEKEGEVRLRVIPWGFVLQFPDIFKNEFLGAKISAQVKQHPGIVRLDDADDHSLMMDILWSHLEGNDIPGTMDALMNRDPLTDPVYFVPTSFKERDGRHADVVGNIGMMRTYILNPAWIPKLVDKSFCAKIVPDEPRWKKHGERLCQIATAINGRIDDALVHREIGKARVDTRRLQLLAA